MTERVVVVGGGISGLTAAYRLHASRPDVEVVLVEADDRLGGKIRSSSFAGVDGVDEGADAFLTRVPFAVDLARELGLGDRLTSPTTATANVWMDGLHPIPEGLLLGVPADIPKLARTKLLTWRGKFRAALEPILPATGIGADSVGLLIRRRFGKQVHERLVDPLVGSIYATDTDRFSLSGVPQILDLASKNRSLLIGTRRARAKSAGASGPIFATPSTGMAALTDALIASLLDSGVEILTGTTIGAIERDGARYVVDGEPADAVVLATPGRATAGLVAQLSPDAAATLQTFEHAGVVVVTLNVRATDWPRALLGFSGYLVPKPVQKWVTAASFASSKWSHWQSVTADGQPGMILRVSLGRDGHDLTARSDDELLDHAIVEVGRHVGLDLQPDQERITRWPMAFPQYRPGHAQRVRDVDAALSRDAPGVLVTGASYRGIGIPACIQQAGAAASAISDFLATVRN